MNVNRTFFYKLHTGTLLLLLLAVSCVTVFAVHPVLSVLSAVTGTLSLLCYGLGEQWRALCRFCLPIALLLLLCNTLLNRSGATVLFYIADRPVLLEGMLYAVFSALSFCGVTFWFSFFCTFLDADRIYTFFSRVSKNLAIIFSLSMALVPQTLSKYAEIKAQARETENKNRRFVNLILHFSTLLSWVLEDSLETALSMKARGALLQKSRKSKPRAGFSLGNTLLSCFSVLVLLLPLFAKSLKIPIYPKFRPAAYFTPQSVFPYCLILLLDLLPLLFKLWEEIKWNSMK